MADQEPEDKDDPDDDDDEEDSEEENETSKKSLPFLDLGLGKNPFKKIIEIMLKPKNLFAAINFFVANKISQMGDNK